MLMKKIFVCIICSLVLISCKKNASGPFGPATVNSVTFLAGNSNSYVLTLKDSVGTTATSRSDSFSVRVTSTQEVLGNYKNLILLEATRLNSSVTLQKVWYKSEKDSLVELAYQFLDYNVPTVFPKSGVTSVSGSLLFLPQTIKMFLNHNAKLDSLRWRDDVRIVYKFPLTKGQKWISFSSPFVQTREVIGEELVHVRAGSFFCMKIKSTIGSISSDSLEFYDYVSQDGLILRTLHMKGVVTTEKNPVGGAIYIVDERLELISKK